MNPAQPNPSRRPLTEAQRIAWLRLCRSESVGSVTFRELVNYYGGAEQAIRALPQLSEKGGRKRPIRVADIDDVYEELEAAQRVGARLVACTEPAYPPLLAVLDAPPPVLYVKGDLSLVERPAIAIVGARNGSAAGQQMTRLLADGLGAEGLVIVSGLARGIDGAAHRASLARGTVAVVAGGIDVVYPPEHAELMASIGERGLLVSERPPGAEPRGQDFPRRNRIISGMALATIVVEAARRSGSLITARLAGEQGRDVLAVPGHPLDPRAEGTNRLIRDGATLITSVADVLEAVAPYLDGGARLPVSGLALADPPDAVAPSPPPELGADGRGLVLASLGPAPVAIDEITRATGLGITEVRIALLELDLAGRLERHGGNRVSLVVASNV